MAIPRLVPLAEACKSRGCSRVRFYTNPEEFPTPIRIGNRIRFREDQLLAKLEELQARSAG